MADETQDTTVEVPEKFKNLVSNIETLSVLDLAELVKVLEKKFGVSASAPVAMVAGGAPQGSAPAAETEKTTFNVVLKEAGSAKIQAIKVVREVTGLGLKEAKDLVDAAPKNVKEGISKDEAEDIKKKLEDAGATVEIL